MVFSRGIFQTTLNDIFISFSESKPTYLSKLYWAILAMKDASPTTWAILPRASPAAHLKIGLGLSRAPITSVRADLRTSSGPNVLLFSAKPWMKKKIKIKKTFQSREERENVQTVYCIWDLPLKMMHFHFLFRFVVIYPKIYLLKIFKTQDQEQSYISQHSAYFMYQKTCCTSLFYQMHYSAICTLLVLNLS